MKYAAINIGPIVGTIMMAKKPRELWAASYMFSYLMECIINEIGKNPNNKIISPAVLKNISLPNVGLYPDRVFVEGDIDLDNVIEKAVSEYASKLEMEKENIRDYLNIMSIIIDYDDHDEESPVKKLNRLLDCMELCNRSVKDSSRNKVLDLIQKKKESPLFEISQNRNTFDVPMLCEIATHGLSFVDAEKWKEICAREKSREQENESINNSEDNFYKEIKTSFREKYYSFHKYICVVQADGDNMGKIVSALPSDKVSELSQTLLEYGCEASRMIEGYGGLPIYAGGDDLLFIAPVVSDFTLAGGKRIRNIFELLSAVDECYCEVDKKVGNLGRPKDSEQRDIHTFVSYGLSISYYKYPLYEALEKARDLLFGTAKNVPGKNAVAWSLRKHSGSGFEGAFTKDTEAGSVYNIFDKLMNISIDEALISAIAHKLRSYQDLLAIIPENGREKRIEAFYKKILEEQDESDSMSYIGTTREMLNALFKCETNRNDKADISKILKTMYGILRTAKFVNGEEDSNE